MQAPQHCYDSACPARQASSARRSVPRITLGATGGLHEVGGQAGGVSGDAHVLAWYVGVSGRGDICALHACVSCTLSSLRRRQGGAGVPTGNKCTHGARPRAA